MKPALKNLAAIAIVAAPLAGCGGSAGEDDFSAQQALMQSQQTGQQNALIAQGKHIFRFDTFGDEAKWTDTLRLHEVISAAVDPVTALSVGLKVDADALPPDVVAGIKNGSVDLKSPATTVTLLKLDAVVGLKGTVESVNGVDRLTRLGVTCALCHSNVDDSFAPGIGKRLDGWPNRDLNPGAIIALSPVLDAATKAVFNSWGPGKYDPRFNIDKLNKPVVIPPAFGLAGIHKITFTGDGDDIAYWNRYVAVTQMGGLGTFTEPRLNLTVTNGSVDLVSSKLPALQAYQLSLEAPPPPAGSFDPAAAARGKLVFEGAGACVSCHSGASFTDANLTLHPTTDSMVEPELPSYAARSATKRYRTTPLKGVWQHSPYFHDGSAATLEDVVRTYNSRRSLGLNPQQINDLTQYLKSLDPRIEAGGLQQRGPACGMLDRSSDLNAMRYIVTPLIQRSLLLAMTLPAIAGLASCADHARLPATKVVGPQPELPAPTRTLLPTVDIAPARGWQNGEKPLAAPPLAVNAFATGLAHPRWLHVLPNGDVLVAESNAPPREGNGGVRAWVMKQVMKRAGAGVPSANRITLLRDADGDGIAEIRSTFLEALYSPFGMALVGDSLYVANADAVVRFPYTAGAQRVSAQGVKVTDLPAGINHHWTKSLIASPDNRKLYVTVGSNSNVGERGMQVEEGRAAIWEIDLQSGTKRQFAAGLRNPNGMAWEPTTRRLWTVVNERDELGSDLVPDYLTSVVDGGFYGWPYSYWGQHVDERVQPPRPDLVAKAIRPDYALGNHVAPLGLCTAEGTALGRQFTSGMFVGLHGSWNRKPKSGYEVVFVPFSDGRPSGPLIPVLSGFLNKDGEALGRPVGVAIDRRGALLVADDVGNTVWRVTSAGR